MRFNTKLILSLLLTVAPSTLAAVNGKCSSGKKGICIATGTCSKYGGSTSNGYCPSDPNNIKCCSNIPCKYNGKSGSCMFTSECSGSTVSGLCPGGSNFKCCLSSGVTTSNVCKKAANAASYARSRAKSKSISKCAAYVADALQKAGFSFKRQGSAYMYHTNGILKGIGFKEISKQTPKKGDIAVEEKTSSHVHGHIQIYDGSNWVSDFVQKSVNVHSKNAGKIHYYRCK